MEYYSFLIKTILFRVLFILDQNHKQSFEETDMSYVFGEVTGRRGYFVQSWQVDAWSRREIII